MAPHMNPPNRDWADSLHVLYKLSALSTASSNDSGEETDENDSQEWTTDSEDGVQEESDNAEGDTPATDAAGTATADHADAEPVAADSSSIAKLCKLLWDASQQPNTQPRSTQPGATSLSVDAQYLLHLADNKQLIGHLASAATRALGALCKAAPFPAAAVAAEAVDSGAYQAAKAATRGKGRRGSAAPQAERSGAATAETAAASNAENLTKESMLQAVQLLTTFACCARCYSSHTDDQNDFVTLFASKMMMLTQIEQAGLLHVIEPLCFELAATLKQQQQQENSETVQCTKLLASACLHVIRFCLIIDRPAQIFWDAVLKSIIYPAVVLATARLEAFGGCFEVTEAAAGAAAAAAAKPRSSSLSATAAVMFDDWLGLWRGEFALGHEPIALADLLSHALCEGYGYKGNDAVLVKLLATSEMQKLLLVATASKAQHLHKLAGGKAVAFSAAGSSSSRQQRGGDIPQHRVPAWHEKLYKACGLQSGFDLTAQYVLWQDSDPGLAVLNVLTLTMQLNMPEFWNKHMRTLSKAVGLLQVRQELQQLLQQPQQRPRQQQQRRRPRQQQQQQQQEGQPVCFLLQPELRIALLLVLIETLAVAPSIKLGVIGLKLASQLAIKGWCCDHDAAFDAVAATVVASGPTGQAGREACTALLEAAPGSTTGSLVCPVLLILAPAYLHIMDTFDPRAEQDVQPEDVATLEAMFAAMAGMVLVADLFMCGRQVEAAFKASPAAASKALEAAVRAGAGSYGHLLTVDSPNSIVKNLRALYSAGQPTPPVALPNTSPATSASPVEGLELFSLLLSSLKFIAERVAKGKGPTEGPLELMLFSVDTLDVLLAMSEGNEAGNTVVAHRWLVLAGRCLIHCSKTTKELITSRAPLAHGFAPLDEGYLAHYLQTITNSTSWLGVCLSRLDSSAVDVAAAAAAQSLAHRIRDQVVGEVLTTIDQTKLSALLTQQQVLAELKRILPISLLDQVAELGGSVCALLPLPYCCNNPGCSSLQGVSEVLSVKSGRCSGCKVAHYDCAQCQKQHWDKHKSACKRLKGHAEAVQACREAA